MWHGGKYCELPGAPRTPILHERMLAVNAYALHLTSNIGSPTATVEYIYKVCFLVLLPVLRACQSPSRRELVGVGQLGIRRVRIRPRHGEVQLER